MGVVRALTKMAINHFGYDVRRVATPAAIQVAEGGTDPITFEYVRERRGYAIFEVDLNDVRAFHSLALPLKPDAHPFVTAIERARNATGELLVKAAIERTLELYYRAVRPTSALEVLDLSHEDVPGLRDCAPNGERLIDTNFLPWSGRGPAALRKSREDTTLFEGLQNGVRAKVSDGVTSFGPVTSAKLKMEVSRLARLVSSVHSHGFTRFDARSPLQVGAFRRGDKYKWVINHGQHRFAAAAAFGIASLPAMVTEVVRREDARFWPQVTSGMFTEAGALAIFDRIYEGTPATICQAWMTDLTDEHTNVPD